MIGVHPTQAKTSPIFLMFNSLKYSAINALISQQEAMPLPSDVQPTPRDHSFSSNKTPVFPHYISIPGYSLKQGTSPPEEPLRHSRCSRVLLEVTKVSHSTQGLPLGTNITITYKTKNLYIYYSHVQILNHICE